MRNSSTTWWKCIKSSAFAHDYDDLAVRADDEERVVEIGGDGGDATSAREQRRRGAAAGGGEDVERPVGARRGGKGGVA